MTSWKATFASLRKVIGSEFWSSDVNRFAEQLACVDCNGDTYETADGPRIMEPSEAGR